MAEGASEAEFATDIAYLRKTWADIRDKARVSAPPTLLYQELSLGQRCCATFVNPEPIQRASTRGRKLSEADGLCRGIHAGRLPLARALYGPAAACSTCMASRRIQRRWPVASISKSGGYLIIDQTEAMTTIDVNTGGFVGVRNLMTTPFSRPI